MRTRVASSLVLSLLVPACGPVIADARDTEDDASSSSTTAASTTENDVSGGGSPTSSATDDSGAESSGEATQGADTSSTGAAPALVELRIDPVYAILDSAVGDQSREFTAIGVTDAGDEIDVTDAVAWTLEGPGSLDQGVLTSPTSDEPVFERARLSASVDGREATAFAAVSVRTQQPHAPVLFNLGVAPGPKPLDYRPVIDKLDVFFLLDTVSWADEEHLIPFYDRVMNVVVPQLQAEGLDIQFGSGRFSAFPVEGSGEETCGDGQGDQPFELWSEISADIEQLDAGLAPAAAGAPIGCLYSRGSLGEALFQIATGEGLDGPGPTFVAANPGPRGGVGFRDDSLALVFSKTFDPLISGLDLLVPMQGEALLTAHEPAEVVEALQQQDIVHFGLTNIVYSELDETGPYHAMAQLAVQTGTVVPPSAWNHPDLDRPAGCAEGECCVDEGDGHTSGVHPYCPMASRYRSDAAFQFDPAEMIARDFYALTHYLLTDVSTIVTGETTSVSGVPLPAGSSTDTFFTLTAVEADPPPEEGMPQPLLEDTTFRYVSPGTNLNYEVAVDADAVPSLPGEPLLYRVSVSLQTDYRAGSVVQEYWLVSPPATE